MDSPGRRETVPPVAAAEQVAAVPPETGVQVPAVSDVVGHDRGRERRPQPVPRRYRRDDELDQHAGVRGRDRVLGRDRHLVLRRAVLRVDLLDSDASRAERVDHVADIIGRAGGGQPAQAVASAAERRLEVLGVAADHPLDLERHQRADALAQACGDLGAGETALITRVRGAVLAEPVAWRPGPAGRVGQHDEPVQVRHQPQVAVGLVQRRLRIDAAVAAERVNDRREPEAGPGRCRQARQRRRLHPRSAAVVDERDRDGPRPRLEPEGHLLGPVPVRAALVLAAYRAERSWHAHHPSADCGAHSRCYQIAWSAR